MAKTRLSHLEQPARASLALAFVLDAAAAALGCPDVRRVMAVTNDALAGSALADLGVDVVADLPDAGLNPAVEHGFALARRGDADAAVAAMTGDLPALHGADLTAAFRAAQGLDRWFVADTEGVGTTVLAAARGADLLPAFGSLSRARHLRLGAVEVTSDGLGRLRRDVDTENDLREALALGVGARTRATLDRIHAGFGSAT